VPVTKKKEMTVRELAAMGGKARAKKLTKKRPEGDRCQGDYDQVGFQTEERMNTCGKVLHFCSSCGIKPI